MVDIPTKEPKEIIIGDTVKWKREDLSADYPASVWTLTYEVKGPTAVGTITAAADGDNFSITIPMATSAAYKPGDYWWAAYVTDGSERYQIDKGTLKIKDNLAALSGTYDGRTHAKKVLDAIEAVIESRATKDQMAYSIAGRSLSKTPIPDLLVLRDRYKAEYDAEVTAEKINNGEKSGKRIVTRFVS